MVTDEERDFMYQAYASDPAGPPTSGSAADSRRLLDNNRGGSS